MKIPAAEKGNLPVFVILFAGLLVALLLYYKLSPIIYGPTPQYNPSQPAKDSSPSASLKPYTSSLKFNVDIPSEFTASQKFTDVILESNDGNIIISRVSTNYNNAQDYLDDLSQKNKFLITIKEEISVNKIKGIRTTLKNTTDNSQQKIIILFVDNLIYSFSTSSEALYPTLDQIAQSFRYTP